MTPEDPRVDVLGELFVTGWAGFGEAVRDGIRPGLTEALARLDSARAEGETAAGELRAPLGLSEHDRDMIEWLLSLSPGHCENHDFAVFTDGGVAPPCPWCAPPAPEVVSGAEAAALPVMVEAGTPKGVREALCVAQMVIGNVSERLVKRDQATRISEVLGALIHGIDVHRPIGVNGKHGDQHTATCGCDGHEAPWTITIAPPGTPPLAVGDVVETAADLDRLPVGAWVEATTGDHGIVTTESHRVFWQEGGAGFEWALPITVRGLPTDPS